MNGHFIMGAGTDVRGLTNAKEIAEKAGMDWTVQRRLVRMSESKKDPTKQVVIDDYHAITRSDNNKVFQIASKRYRPEQNVELIATFQEFYQNGQLELETVGCAHGGAVVWAVAKIPEGGEFTLPGNDSVGGYVLLATSHDSTLLNQGLFVYNRRICTNSLSSAHMGGRGLFRYKKNASYERRELAKAEAREKLANALGFTRELQDKAQLLAETKANKEIMNSYVYQLTHKGENLLDVIVRTQSETPREGSILDHIADTSVTSYRAFDPRKHEHSRKGERILASIVNSPGAKMESADGTMWGALNGVTHYVDHVASRDKQEGNAQSAVFGEGAKFKQEALDLAVMYSMALARN